MTRRENDSSLLLQVFLSSVITLRVNHAPVYNKEVCNILHDLKGYITLLVNSSILNLLANSAVEHNLYSNTEVVLQVQSLQLTFSLIRGAKKEGFAPATAIHGKLKELPKETHTHTHIQMALMQIILYHMVYLREGAFPITCA